MRLIASLKKYFTDYSRLSPLLFTLVFVAVISQYSFHSLEAAFYDFAQRFDFAAKFSDQVVIVTMDERSDEFLGERYPYSLITHQKTIGNLIGEKPLAIGLLANMGDQKKISSEQEGLITLLQQYVQQGGIFRFGTDFESASLSGYTSAMLHLGLSQTIVEGDVHQDAKDGVVRRLPLTRSGELSLVYWLANEIRQKKGREYLSLKALRGAFYDSMQDGDYAFFRYAKNPLPSVSTVIQRVPYHLVANGTFPKDFFKNKVVLIGPSYVANSNDYAFTPFEKARMVTPKLSIVANMVEALVENQTVQIIPRVVSSVLAGLIGIFLALAIARANPANGLMITGGIALSMLGTNYLLFSFTSFWLPLVPIFLTIGGAYYIGIPFKAIDEYQRRFEIQEETTLLKKVEKLKQNFISLMSHDLKTPVAKISGLVDTMRRQVADNPELVKSLNSIMDSTKELNNFITSILDLTKVESSNITLNLVSEDLNTIVEQVVGDLRFELHREKMKVSTQLATLYPIQLDPKLMARVVSNLLSNAIKYAGIGSEVTITTEDLGEWVSLSIKDNGSGIPAEDIEHIFDKFYRVKNDANHAIKGSGLGLYLVKYFIELHGGTIAVQSQLGQGTEFIIKLKNA